MATTINPTRSFYADLDNLHTCFSDLDPENTGYIGYGELTQLVQNMPSAEESVVLKLMEDLDKDKDGKVSLLTCIKTTKGGVAHKVVPLSPLLHPLPCIIPFIISGVQFLLVFHSPTNGELKFLHPAAVFSKIGKKKLS